MVINMMVIGKMINKMEQEYSLGKMVTNIMENGKMVNKMEKEY